MLTGVRNASAHSLKGFSTNLKVVNTANMIFMFYLPLVAGNVVSTAVDIYLETIITED